MNRILSFGLAAVLATALTPTVFADKGDGHGGGGRGGGGGGGRGGGGGGAPHVSAPSHVASAPHFSAPSRGSFQSPPMRAQSAPRIVERSAPRSFERAAPAIQQSRPNVVTRSRSNAPSVAFTGHSIRNDNAVVNNNAAVRNERTFSTNDTTRFAGRTQSRDFRVPMETSRSWDRGRVHEWNNHRYRWYGGNWVIIDPGFGYPYGYGYDYDDVTPYSATTYSVEGGADLAMSAQRQLARLGYSPGPIDGVIGGQTRDAIADFQNDNRLPVTGNLDTATIRALGL